MGRQKHRCPLCLSSGMRLRPGQPPVPVAGMAPEKAGPQAALVPAGVAVPAGRQHVAAEAVGVAADHAALGQRRSAGLYS